MQKLILASHGGLATGMLAAMRMILGDGCAVQAYDLEHYETPQDILRAARQDVEQADGQDIVILCDLKGGSVANQLMTLCEAPNVSLVTGMNLCLALELAYPEGGRARAVEQAVLLAKDNICAFDAGKLKELAAQRQEDELWE